jgi:hypothetical protein
MLCVVVEFDGAGLVDFQAAKTVWMNRLALLSVTFRDGLGQNHRWN